MKRLGGVAVVFALLCALALSQAGVVSEAYVVAATDANTTVTLGFPAHSLAVHNVGTDTAYVNVSGSGVAASTGAANHPVLAGHTLHFAPESGRLDLIGVICASGETATVHLHALR